MASIGVILTSTYHTKELNPWPNSSTSCVVNCSRPFTCQGDMQPFEGNLSTHGCLTSLRNKPQHKQPGQLSAPIPGWIVSQCVQPSFNGEKCVLLLCTWKPAFLKFSHICPFCHKFLTAIFVLLNTWLHNSSLDNTLACIHLRYTFLLTLLTTVGHLFTRVTSYVNRAKRKFLEFIIMKLHTLVACTIILYNTHLLL